MHLHCPLKSRVAVAAVPLRRAVCPRSSQLRPWLAGRLSCSPLLLHHSNSTTAAHLSSSCSCSRAPSFRASSSSRSRARSSIIPAAGSSSGDGEPGLSSLDELEILQLKLPELKERCKALGLPVKGKKSELAQRIIDHLQQQQQQEEEEEEADQQQQQGPSAAAADESLSASDLLSELESEIELYSPEELAACLADRGLSTQGGRRQQVATLAAALLAEFELEPGAAPPAPAAAAAPQQQPVAQDSIPAAAAAGASGGGVVSSSGAGGSPERAWLVADKQQVLYDELLAMGAMRQELVDILADMGQTAAEGETLEELAERASWLLAEEEVLLLEQQAAAGAAAGGPGGELGPDGSSTAAGPTSQVLADHPSSFLDVLTATDINKMKVDDLRLFLRRLGLSDQGSRYVLRDRLLTMLVVRKAATAGDMDYLLRQLSSMTLSELRSELERRNLDLSGTKASLELRLAQAMVVEIAGPEAAMMLGQTVKSEDEGDVFEPEAPILEDYDEFLTAVMDPAFRVGLICGTTPLTTAAADGSSSDSSRSRSRLYRVTQALATAVTLIDELHTAPLDETQAAAIAAKSTAAAADAVVDDSSSNKGQRGRKSKTTTSSSSGSSTAAAADSGESSPLQPHPSQVTPCGITVDVYWGDDSGAFYQLPRTALAATAPADLAAALPALATATFKSVSDLAAHLKASGAGAALSLLPGGGLAVGGQMAAAMAAAEVPFAVQNSSSSSGSSSSGSSGKRGRTSSKQQQPVVGRAAVLRELKQLGYLTLPVFEIQRDKVLAVRQELETWLEAVTREEEEEREVDPDDALAAAADEQQQQQGESSSSSGSRKKKGRKPLSSSILKAWTVSRFTAAAAAAGTAEQAAAAEGAAADSSKTAAAAAVSEDIPPLVQSFVSWCESVGVSPDSQLLSVSAGGGGEAAAAVRGGVRLLDTLLGMVADASCPPVLLVEPLHRSLCRWEVVVTVSPEDGPVSLLPVEVEVDDIQGHIVDADLALQEWRMMQAGVDPEQISLQLEVLSGDEPSCIEVLQLPDTPDPLPYNTRKLHSPPRSSAKLVHTMRHAAAKAVSDLGLTAAGLVRVRGWYAAKPGWQDTYSPKPEDILKMPDFDARQLQRIREEELSRRASEPLPLSDYCDEVTLLPDLTKFDPATRCAAETNGEGDVLLADLELEVHLHTTSLAGIQAAEVGLSPGGLARHLINMALFAAGQEPLLPPPPPPSLGSSAQWAQFTGANDDLGEITLQLAEQNEELREAFETSHHTAAEEARRSVVAQLDLDKAVRDIVDGLSFVGGTLEALETPVEEPEEWTPEFDTRTQEEIHAERDAQRTPEDLAARQMRDENLPVYGDQPIKYDRYDPAFDLAWEPPFTAAAEAGQPLPSIEQLRQEVADRLAARERDLSEGPLSDAEHLPDVTEDEVMYTRLLEGSFYEGGVKEAIRRRAEMAKETAGGGGAATLAAASFAANVDAAKAAGEAAALAEQAAGSSSSSGPGLGLAGSSDGSGSSGSLIAAADRWPWPTQQEVLDEALERRAAQRVWVLIGGDGPARQQALRSGANIWAKLQRCCDLQVDAFLLPPAGAGLDEVKRRAALLARRTEWMALGIPADEYPDSMRDDALLSMPPPDLTALQRTVIVAGPSQLARHTLEDAVEAAEVLGRRAAATFHSAPVLEQQQIQAARDTQMELEAHFVEGVAGGWGGGGGGQLPPAPRFLDLEEFVSEASGCGATIILAVQDTLTATGELQHLLDASGVGYTGLTADYALKCCNKIALHKHITEFADELAAAAAAAAAEDQADTAAAAAADDDDNESSSPDGDESSGDDESVGLIPLPVKVIKTDKLISGIRDPQIIDQLFEELMMDWAASDSFVLRPPAHSGGLGVARIHTPDDLAAYAAAIASVLPRMPPGTFTQQQQPVTLPLEPPALLVAEPWVGTDPVTVAVGEGGGLEVAWEGSSSRWLEVSIGLVGELGSMVPLPPTLISTGPDGSRHYITPPPPHILPADSMEAAQSCAAMLAIGLGLRSIAAVDGFVNVDTGELIVRDVNPTPALTDGSPLLQQALQLDPPLLPHQLFRLLAREAWLTNREQQEAAAASGSSISSAYYSGSQEGGGALGADDFELGDVGGGDIFAGSGGEGFSADADGADGVEDEDMQAAGYTV